MQRNYENYGFSKYFIPIQEMLLVNLIERMTNNLLSEKSNRRCAFIEAAILTQWTIFKIVFNRDNIKTCVLRNFLYLFCAENIRFWQIFDRKQNNSNDE